ncbi:hypothetical protein KSE_60730 [Kitasatospora setae KM-6054]|uniref:PD-(D/E)XK endonuclease-like domain-containing protein n=1 Tax=Kitasatospora setae (strain ATCC 33774 / DSM 43861 / JCM 3304 / KCC A-0304 / NBRC 14216 / KM-6054) TaxID=452652 RepID=E4N105_KITSK|nr:hypothetical protein KSE_60730 [Kitasatospora setae KM-6054]
MRSALKARPRATVPPGSVARFKSDSQEHFNLGPVMEALDLIEFDHLSVDRALERVGAPAGRPPLEQGFAAWTRLAVHRYLSTLGPELVPVRHDWVFIRTLDEPDDRGALRYELCVWGRRYVDPSSRTRELRIPLAKRVDQDERDESELAVMAMVLAEGRPAELPDFRFWKQYAEPVDASAESAAPPESVRITVVDCVNGRAQPILVDTPEAIRERYRKSGRKRLADVVTGTEYRPGRGCGDCKLIATCPALPRVPGLLGIDDPNRARRTWSVTNGRYYAGNSGKGDGCPARDRFHRLRLPPEADREWGPAVVRGHAVHVRIQQQHEAHPGVACRPDEAPDGGGPWTAGRWSVSGREADQGARMVAAHSRYCPYRLSTVNGIVHEAQVTLHDPAADVLITARPDTLYREGGMRVYRETKTDVRRGLPVESDLLAERPQLALALLWMALTPDRGGPGRVELEVLGTDGARLEILMADQRHLVERAREIVRGLVENWHGDTSHTPNPGQHCARCSTAVWCGDRADLPGRTQGAD